MRQECTRFFKGTSTTVLCEIFELFDNRHPVKADSVDPQFGLFAVHDIRSGQILCEYCGEVQTSSSTAPSLYTVGVQLADYACEVSADIFTSKAAFANDFRGIASEPNAELFQVLY